MTDSVSQILLPVKSSKQVVDDLLNPVVYSGIDYGITAKSSKGVKIAIIDSGCPKHRDIKRIEDFAVLVDGVPVPYDRFGHSTMVSGILAASNAKKMQGFARDASLYFAKVTNDAGESDYSALVAGILWAVVKQVDIIVIALETATDYPVLRSAITKAYEENICIIAASGNGKDGESYPSHYPEVLGFKARPKNKNAVEKVNEDGDIIVYMPNSGIPTTFTNNQYIKTYGSSFAAAIGGGLAALLIEERKEKGYRPQDIYEVLLNKSHNFSYNSIIKREIVFKSED